MIIKETRIDGWKVGRTDRYRQDNEKRKEEERLKNEMTKKDKDK